MPTVEIVTSYEVADWGELEDVVERVKSTNPDTLDVVGEMPGRGA